MRFKPWKKRAFILAVCGYGLLACTPAIDLSTPEQPTAVVSPSASLTPINDLSLPSDATKAPSQTVQPATSTEPSAIPTPAPIQPVPEAYGLKNVLYWRVTAPSGPTSYLVGTVHINLADGYQWPAAFEQALKNSKALYLEADTSELEKDPQAVLEKSLDPEQIVLQTLSDAEYQSLSERLAAVGVPEAVLPLLKPWYVNLLLSSPPEEAVPNPTQVMDNLLKNRAQAEQITVKYLETALDQFDMLDAIPTGEHIRLIREALSQPADLSDTQTRESVAAYNAGDLSVIEKAETELKQESLPFYEQSLVLRNQAWLKTLIPAMQSESVMVGVGSLHMVGPSGLTTQLREAGFEVEWVTSTGDNNR
jgi:uncharacterized protein